MRHTLPKHLLFLFALYCVASLAHFVHNAEFLGEYPNMPAWLARWQVYAVWLGITAIGVLGLLVACTRLRFAGIFLIGAYAALGFDGLAHYSLAPLAAHTVAMNFTIWSEALAAAALLAAALRILLREVKHRSALAQDG